MAKKQVIDMRGAIRKVPLGDMHTQTRHAQREKINMARVDHLHANMDLDKIGLPVLSERGGLYYIVDGQHRIEALKRWMGDGWEAQKIECRVYGGLTEEQEAELFLGQNDTLQVNAFDKFRVAVNAGRADEVAINQVVQKEGLCISRDDHPGAIRAVSTLRRVYQRSDADVLAKAVRIIRDAYGDVGFKAQIIDGMAHLCQRYNGTLDEPHAVNRLSSVRGGINGLIGKAEVLHKQTGNYKAHCYAAAAVDIINAGRGRGNKKLPSWWRDQ